MANFYVINHNKTNFTYEVLADDNNRLSIICRDQNGKLSVRKAWIENNELHSKDSYTGYESYEEYLEKLPELESMLNFSTIKNKLLYKKDI